MYLREPCVLLNFHTPLLLKLWMRSLRCQSQIYLQPSPSPHNLYLLRVALYYRFQFFLSLLFHPMDLLWYCGVHFYIYFFSSPSLSYFIFVYIFSCPLPPFSARFGGIASCFKGISYAGSVSFVSLWRKCLAENGALRLVMKNEIEKWTEIYIYVFKVDGKESWRAKNASMRE